MDIATMNLLCATDLPGAENLDVSRCLARLDEWAARVKEETARHAYRITDPRYTDQYLRSEACYRASMLLQVLQEDCGVHYNMERVRDIDFTNAKDLFIHGMIDDTNGGTCVSMPVLYVAIGRRLGYPLRLVLAKAHVFARWDDAEGGERFNIEGSGDGFASFPDEYYRTWPQPISEAEVRAGRFLQSLTPAEELAVFLAARGHCLHDIGRLPEARVAYARAHRFDPSRPEYLGFLAEAVGIPRTGERVATSREPSRHDPLEELRRVEIINAQNRRLMETGVPPAIPGPGMPPVPGRR
jgi:hypothetical protein